MSNEEAFIAEHQEQFNGWLQAREETARQERESKINSLRDQITNLQGELAGLTGEAQG